MFIFLAVAETESVILSSSATVVSAVVNIRLIGTISEIEHVIIAIRSSRRRGRGSRSGRRRRRCCCCCCCRGVRHRVKIIRETVIVVVVNIWIHRRRCAIAHDGVIVRIIVVVRSIR